MRDGVEGAQKGKTGCRVLRDCAMRRGGLGTMLPSASNEKRKHSTSVEHFRVEARALRSGENAAPSSN
jgi:hypothetical protein